MVLVVFGKCENLPIFSRVEEKEKHDLGKSSVHLLTGAANQQPLHM